MVVLEQCLTVPILMESQKHFQQIHLQEKDIHSKDGVQVVVQVR